MAMSLQPIPYYIVAFILLVVFGFVWPVLPISGGAEMNIDRQGFAFAASIVRHSSCAALSLVLVGMGAVVHRHALACLQHRHRGLPSPMPNSAASTAAASCFPASCAARSPAGERALALSLGAIFNGAIITEVVFGYPGLGTLLVRAVNAGDYSLVLGITSVSIIAVATAILVIDIVYPLLDPRA